MQEPELDPRTGGLVMCSLPRFQPPFRPPWGTALPPSPSGPGPEMPRPPGCQGPPFPSPHESLVLCDSEALEGMLRRPGAQEPGSLASVSATWWPWAEAFATKCNLQR